MSQNCVRVNPLKWVDGSSKDEEHAILVTVKRPRSHDLFKTKNIVILGPLGLEEGGIPLRTLTIGPGNRAVATSGHQTEENGFHVDSTTFYAHYAGNEGIVAAQFEIIWQFQRFARNETVPGVSGDLRGRILTLGGHEEQPRTAFDERSRQFTYQGWKYAHFLMFWEEYKMLKDTAHIFRRHVKFAHDEKVHWRKLAPPRPLTDSEKKQFEQEFKPKPLHEPADPSKLDMTLEELVLQSQSPKKSPLHRARNAGITKEGTPPPARAAYNGSPRQRQMESSPSNLMSENSPISRPRDIYGSKRANRFSRRTQGNRRNRRNSSQPNRFRNFYAPLTEINMRCFDALTRSRNHQSNPQPRSPPPEEPYTIGLVDPNKERLVERYLEDQSREVSLVASRIVERHLEDQAREANNTPMELDE